MINRRLFLGGTLAGAVAPASVLAETGMLDARLLVGSWFHSTTLNITTIGWDPARHASFSVVGVMWCPPDGQPPQFAFHRSIEAT